MVVVQVGEKHNVRWAFRQQFWPGIPSVALKKKDSVPQERVGQHADAADVDENCGVAYVVDLSQVISLSRCLPPAGVAGRIGPVLCGKQGALYPLPGILSIPHWYYARAVAKSVSDGRGGQEAASMSPEGDCRTSFAMPVKRECNSLLLPPAASCQTGGVWYNRRRGGHRFAPWNGKEARGGAFLCGPRRA